MSAATADYRTRLYRDRSVRGVLMDLLVIGLLVLILPIYLPVWALYALCAQRGYPASEPDAGKRMEAMETARRLQEAEERMS